MSKDIYNDTSTNDKNTASILMAGRDSEAIRSAVDQVVHKKKKNGLPYGVHKEELTDKQGNDRRMTAKMHSFASNIVQGMSPTEAYKRSYDCAQSSDASCATNANRLIKDARIAQLLQSFFNVLKENVITDSIATRRHVMGELYKHAQSDEARLSDRIKSLELMGRAIGMFTDKVATQTEEVSIDTLKKELESSLALLKPNKVLMN